MHSTEPSTSLIASVRNSRSSRSSSIRMAFLRILFLIIIQYYRVKKKGWIKACVIQGKTLIISYIGGTMKDNIFLPTKSGTTTCWDLLSSFSLRIKYYLQEMKSKLLRFVFLLPYFFGIYYFLSSNGDLKEMLFMSTSMAIISTLLYRPFANLITWAVRQIFKFKQTE
jgi:hypothetical protein